MYELTWQKPLKVGKRDLYTIDLLSWTENEDILTLIPTSTSTDITIESGVIITDRKGRKSIVGVIVSGLSAGVVVIRLDYSTATRTDYVTINLIVGETCLIH